MPEIQIKEALNKAFVILRPERAAIDKFKANLITLIDGIQNNPTEREEFQKNLFSDFLKNTWYAPDYFINTHKSVDLVIHNGDSAAPIGVMIEAKKPGNKNEMVSRGNLNTKAMQELLLYYLRETIDENNLYLRHLIITNAIEWFIFDASEFYRHFSKNKILTDLYGDFKTNSLLGKETNYFYTSIASPFIEKVKNDIEYTYFNITEFEKIIRNNDKEEDNKLINLYKILSPEHLLKKSFVNDSNTLNQNFYAEFLYIIGLTETKKEGKKIIERYEKKKQQPASLIENTIFQLSYDVTDDLMLSEISLELNITWINRILFLKLLEAQQLQYQEGNSDYAFLNINTVKDFNDLNTLFFNVLAVKPQSRDEKLIDKFKNVPYLNSSLFEKTENEGDYLLISNLKNEEMDIFSSTVLKDGTGAKRKGKIKILDYIFALLDAYDFSSEGSEQIQEEEKTLINASVLGLIFEKINSYNDGSFFTPGFITSYICSETIKNVVIGKFNQIKNWKAKKLKDIYNKINNTGDIEEANKIINSITVLDHAVGSGHFLVSALNEIIAIKSELGILADHEGKRIRCEIKVFNDELIVYDEVGDYFEYKQKIKEKQRIQETLFQEKRKIIENCLFGVDINPISVKICRLRLWIELLKNTYYTKESGYKELETLPNLELNIKCGNSLISRYEIDIDISETIKNLDFTVEDYKIAVYNYKNSTDKSSKQNLTEKIEKIKNGFKVQIKKRMKYALQRESINGEITSLTKQGDFFDYDDGGKTEKRLVYLYAELSKIEQKIREIENSKIYDNAFEWRLEFPELLDDNANFTGFDAVIGNPPYISAPAMVDTNPEMRKAIVDSERFKTLYQKWDLYIPFMELGLQLLCANGIFTMIVPYPLTNQTYAKKIKELIIDQYNLLEIVDLNNTKVFENATVSNCIPFISKSKPTDSCFISQINDQKQIIRIFKQSYSDLVQDENTAVWNLTAEKRETSRYSQMNILGDFCYISVGMVLNADEKNAKGEFTKDDLISETYDDIHCKKYIEAKDIERYHVKNIRYLEYNTDRCPNKLRRTTFKELYETSKLMFNRLGNLMVYYDEDTKFLHSDSMFSAVLWKDLKKVDNKSITTSIKRYSRYSRKEMETYSKQIDLRYLLGILNSKYAGVLLSNLRGGDYHIYPEHLRNLPIPLVPKNQQEQIITPVDKILALKSVNAKADTSALEKQIDDIVYSLYGLTPEEIEIVERDK